LFFFEGVSKQSEVTTLNWGKGGMQVSSQWVWQDGCFFWSTPYLYCIYIYTYIVFIYIYTHIVYIYIFIDIFYCIYRCIIYMYIAYIYI
jgi:hypothetical protein